MHQPYVPFEQRYQDTRQAFDGVAAEYDGPLGNNRLVQHMREALWRSVQKAAPPGARLLDLGCGTGIDAVFFAQQGYRVTGIDASPEMVKQTCHRAEASGVSEKVTALNLGIQDLEGLRQGTFDAIYSDLGVLNCMPDLEATARDCAALLKPHGGLVFSVIGRVCPWELAFYTLRGDLARARVRFAEGQSPVSLQGGRVWTRYYAPGEFYRIFARRFELRACRGLNLFLPPPYLVGMIDRHPGWYQLLARLDRLTAGLPLFNRAGDHFLMVLSRRG